MFRRSPARSITMGRIRATFDRLRTERRKALIPFIMGGDPDLRTTASLLCALDDAGADLIEVGIPFSDPLADGPTIQRAALRSLSRGTTPRAVLKTIGRVAARLRAPIAVLSYWNPIIQFGDRHAASSCDPTAFVRAAVNHGVSGLIIPDLPPEESAGFVRASRPLGCSTIFLAAPTSPAERLRRIARLSEGFIYYVSVTGTTGARKRLPPELVQGVRQLLLVTTTPVCVGFGISTPSQAEAVARVADGVIVGSALIHALEPHARRSRRLLREASRFLSRFRNAV